MITESFVIPSREDQASLELRPLDRDYFLAEVRSRGVVATARVSSFMSDGLGAFFSDLAVRWHGWAGERRWSTLEQELTLTAKSDRTGHVDLNVRLVEGAPARWTVNVSLILEACQLDRLAVAAPAFEASVIRRE